MLLSRYVGKTYLLTLVIKTYANHYSDAHTVYDILLIEAMRRL